MNILLKAFSIALFIACTSTKTFAQHPGHTSDKLVLTSPDTVDENTRPHILKTNLAGLLSIFYEAQVLPKRSLQISINRADIGILWGDEKYFSLTPAFKFYLSKKEGTKRRPYPSGFYVSPYLRYVNVRDIGRGWFSSTKLYEVSYNLFGGGAVAGYQVIFRKGLTLDFFAGGGYLPVSSSKIIYTSTTNYPIDVSAEDYKKDIRLGICVGYAFK